MEYKKYNCNSYNIHTIKTDKFKTVRMEIIFSRIVKKEEMPLFTFLSDLLSFSSKKYPRRKDIVIRLEELYRASFYATTNKAGNLFTITFIMEFIDPEYINDKNYLKDAITFPFEIINNPNIKNKEFDITTINIIKKRLLEEIDSIKENSDRLAIINALKTMDEESPSSFRVLGTKEDIDGITNDILYKTYIDLLNHSNCDIFIIGNTNMDICSKYIKEVFKNNIIKTNNIKLVVDNKVKNKVTIKSQKGSFIQSTLVMIYNIKSLDKYDKDVSFNVFNYILGSGGISSKLYKYLRTDNSLCYGVRSLYLKHDELLIIFVSLDNSNVKKAINIIKKSINEMIKGIYTSEDIKDAISNLEFSLKVGLDNNVSILNNYIFNYFDNLPLIDERINMLKKVSKNDLLRCGKHLKLNTQYIQCGGDNIDK